MSWGYPLFILMLCGLGVVYLFWHVDAPAAYYGMVMLNVALILATLSFTQAALLGKPRGWQNSAARGLAVGLWIWVVAALLDGLDLFLHTNVFDSKADFFWAIGYLPMFAGLSTCLRESGGLGSRQVRVALLILAASYAAVFGWYLWPQLTDVTRDVFSRTIDVAWVSFNFLLLGILVTISRGPGILHGPLSAAFHLLAVATVLMIGADAMLRITPATSFLFQLLDIPYFLIYFLFFQAGQEFVPTKRRVLAQ